MHAPLASTAAPVCALAQTSAGRVALWIALLLLVVIAGSVALFWIRRRLLGTEPPDTSTGLTLQDIRGMHQRGVISDEEFAAAKKVILGAAGDASAPSRNPITGKERERPAR